MLIFQWEKSFKRAVGVSINTFLRDNPLNTWRGRRVRGFYPLAIKRRILEVLDLLFQHLVIYFGFLPLIVRILSTPKAKRPSSTTSRTSFFRCYDNLLLLHFAFQLLVFYLLSSVQYEEIRIYLLSALSIISG